MPPLALKRVPFLFVILALGWMAIPLQNRAAGPLRQTKKNTLVLIRTLELGPWDIVTAVSWSPSGEIVAVAAGDQLIVYPIESWKPLVALKLGALTRGLAFSPDGRLLAAGSQDGYLRIWSLDRLQQDGASASFIELAAHRKGVNTVSFSPDGSLLASGGNDAIARVWNPENGELIETAVGGTFAIPSLDFSPDGAVIGVVNGGLVRLRQVGSERITGTFQAASPLFNLDYSPDGSLLAVTGVDGMLRLWKVEEAYRTGHLDFPEPLLLPANSKLTGTFRDLVWQVSFSADGRWLAAAGGDGKIRLWDPESGDEIAAVIAHPRGASGLAFSPDGSMLASGGLDGSVKIWEIEP